MAGATAAKAIFPGCNGTSSTPARPFFSASRLPGVTSLRCGIRRRRAKAGMDTFQGRYQGQKKSSKISQRVFFPFVACSDKPCCVAFGPENTVKISFPDGRGSQSIQHESLPSDHVILEAPGGSLTGIVSLPVLTFQFQDEPRRFRFRLRLKHEIQKPCV